MSNKTQISIISSVKDVTLNGGYVKVGDGNVETSLIISKEGTTITLDDDEIVELMRTLKTVNPSICV